MIIVKLHGASGNQMIKYAFVIVNSLITHNYKLTQIYLNVLKSTKDLISNQ
jgi:hypothetical protein